MLILAAINPWSLLLPPDIPLSSAVAPLAQANGKLKRAKT
jgi:hypothetical protein